MRTPLLLIVATLFLALLLTEARGEGIPFETVSTQHGNGYVDAIVTDAGDILAVGRSDSWRNSTPQRWSALVARFTNAGRLLNDTVLTTYYWAIPSRIFRLAPDRYAIVGTAQLTPDSDYRAWLCHVDQYGQYLWDTSFFASRTDGMIDEVIRIESGDLFALFRHRFTAEPVHALRFGVDGTGAWRKVFDEIPYYSVESFNVVELHDRSGLILGGNHFDAKGLRDPFLFQISYSGEVVWHRSYPGPYDERYRFVVELTNGRLLMSLFRKDSDSDAIRTGTSFWTCDRRGELLDSLEWIGPGKSTNVIQVARVSPSQLLMAGIGGSFAVAYASAVTGRPELNHAVSSRILSYPRMRLLDDRTILYAGTKSVFDRQDSVWIAAGVLGRFSLERLGVEESGNLPETIDLR